MAKIPLNPLKWFKKNSVSQKSPPSNVFPKRQPQKKSGAIFMYLITLQKVLQSLELALRQGMDHNSLLLKAREVVSNLNREAEAAGEDELAQGAGQVLAYQDTVLEGRLILDGEGIGVVMDFSVIFKDALGDAAPGIQRLDRAQLEEWNARYQNLMARMKPIEEDAPVAEPEPELTVEAFPSDLQQVALSLGIANGEGEEPADEEAAADIMAAEPAAVNFEQNEEPPAPDEALEEIQTVEAAAEYQIQDVVIPDAELKSARERLESNEPLPIPAPVFEQEAVQNLVSEKKNGASRWNGDGPVKSPVQLEEVERLKKKLLQLHEKQEMLSSKMSGILGDLKKNVQTEQKERRDISIEKMDVDELEDLIFIGRKKG